MTKPTEVLESKGSYEHDPQRRRKPVPKSEKDFGNAPSYFSDSERKVWRDLKDQLPKTVLTSSDKMMAEALCMLVAKMRNREPMMASDMSTMVRILSEFGMSPVSRAKLAPIDKKDDNKNNPYAKFAIVK